MAAGKGLLEIEGSGDYRRRGLKSRRRCDLVLGACLPKVLLHDGRGVCVALLLLSLLLLLLVSLRYRHSPLLPISVSVCLCRGSYSPLTLSLMNRLVFDKCPNQYH